MRTIAPLLAALLSAGVALRVPPTTIKTHYMASVSTEEKVALEEKYGLAPGILGRDAPAGKGTKAPSIKDMKATIRKAGFGVADLVEKSDVVKRYQEALARLGK